ncbi:hypothetical protein OAB57_03830, partial [Bacteriovoracaceae bacterium]|nr:hypothetical protein [Bacteriovoracaceae bacterium]
VLSAKNESTARWLSIAAGFLCLIAAFPAVVIGMVAHITPWAELGLTPAPDAALTLPHALHYLTPTLISTIGLGALCAAVMSSADSSILSASTLGAWNVYRPLTKRVDQVPKVIKKLIWIVGIAATLMALKIKSVYGLWFLCSDFVYCILFPQLVLALFDKKANTIGAISGFLVAITLRLGAGEPVLGIPQLITYPMTDIDGNCLFPFRTLAMVSSLLTIMLVSRMTQKISPTRPLQVKKGRA